MTRALGRWHDEPEPTPWTGRGSYGKRRIRSPPGRSRSRRSRVQHLRHEFHEFERERSRCSRSRSRPSTSDLHGIAQSLADAIMDLQVPCENLQGLWSKLIRLRSRLRSHDGNRTPAYNSFSTSRPSLDPLDPNVTRETYPTHPKSNWIGKLQELYSRASQRPVKKDEIKYTTHEESAASSSTKQFRSTVEASNFTYRYHGSLCNTKKQAEHSAAYTAIRAEFPECDLEEALSSQSRPDRNLTSLTFKSKLHEELKRRLGMEITRDQLPYETTFFEDNQPDELYVSRVTLKCYGADGASYTGNLQPTRKLAEQSAAEAGITCHGTL